VGLLNGSCILTLFNQDCENICDYVDQVFTFYIFIKGASFLFQNIHSLIPNSSLLRVYFLVLYYMII